MVEPVFPLRMVVFQGLLLLVAIAIESVVFRRSLKLAYKTSVEYAASVNLFSVSVGWLLFLGLVGLFPEMIKTQLISYIFFGRFFSQNDIAASIPVWVVMSGFIIFFATYLVKLWGLNGLLGLLQQTVTEDTQPTENLSRLERYKMAREARSQNQRPVRNRATAVLQANAFSFTAILLVLFIGLGR